MIDSGMNYHERVAASRPKRSRSYRPRFAYFVANKLLAAALTVLAATSPLAVQALPSVIIGRPALISPIAAEAAYPVSLDATSTRTLGALAPTANEIVELARALHNSPDEIYDFVRNYVDTVFIFGAQKGALGAIVDKSGTPFDQAQLMVNLLRQAGYTAVYKLGTITLTAAQFSAWTNITNPQAACDLLASGGIPAAFNTGTTSIQCSPTSPGTFTTVTMEHIWVDVVITGTHYLFDPSYKSYAFAVQPAALTTVAGLTSGDALMAATGTGYTTGVNSGVNFVKGLNSSALQAKLTAYATSVQSYIQTHNSAGTPSHPLISGKLLDLIGGREISRYTGSPVRQATLPYPATASRTWTGNIPDQFRTLLTINLTKFTTAQTYATVVNNQKIFIDDVYSRRLVYNTNFSVKAPATFIGSLSVVDEFGRLSAVNSSGTPVPLATFTNADDPNYSVGTLTLTVNHPYVADAAGTTSTLGTYMDTVVTRTLRFSTPFMIVHGWGDTNRGLVDKWGATGNGSLPLQPPNGCETCSVGYVSSTGDGTRQQMGANWLLQSSKAGRLHASIANSIYTHHHSIGIVAGDTVISTVNISPQGPTPTYNWRVTDNFDRLDVESGFSVTSFTESALDRRAAIHAIAATSDALEGAVAAQISDLPDTVSTAMRFEWGNAPPNATEDPSGSGGTTSIGARRFYDFTAANTSHALSLMLVEGKLTTTQLDQHPGNNPTIGSSETGTRQGAVSQLISSYASGPGTGTWDVVASEEAFLGPGQRAGSFTLVGTNTYIHDITQQRGGAFVATRYNASGDPVEIAHIAANAAYSGGGAVGIKGGGGGAQTNQQSVYDPATAADILKSRFVDRTKAIGVDLESGDITYQSSAGLSVGSGAFPYSLSANLIWRGGQAQDQSFGPLSHVAPATPFTTNWNNTASMSGSGIEAMGETDIRATPGTVAAFLAMQDIYRSSVSPQREVAGLLTAAWWAHQIMHNVVTVNVGAETKQFLMKYDGTTWFQAGPGSYASIAVNGPNPLPFYTQPSCGGGPSYVTTRGWDYSQRSFVVTNANGDKQNFAFWSTQFQDGTGSFCAFLHGFRLTNWVFPYGMTVNLTYQASAPGLLDDLVKVNNSLGRQINFIQSGLGGFNNGLTGANLRTVTSTGPIGPTTTTVTHTDPAAHTTTINFSRIGDRYLLSNVVREDNLTGLAYTYDSLGRVKQAQDAVALQSGGRNPYSFYLAFGARADRVDPAGGQYTVFNDIYSRTLGYIDEIGRTTGVAHDGLGRTTKYTYPEGNTENFTYDDHNNTTGLTRNPKPGSLMPAIAVSATWDQSWNKPTILTDAIGCATNLVYWPTNPGLSLLHTATRCKPDTTQSNPVYTFTYNALGQPLQSTDPTSLLTQNAYDPTTGTLTSTTVDPAGVNSITSFTYDAIGNVATVIDPRTFVTENQYDADRRKTVVIHHNGAVTATAIAAERTQYDVLGREFETDAGITFSGSSVLTWQMTDHKDFTPNSVVRTEKNGAGESTNYTYDAMDRATVVTDPISRRVATVYDLAGQSLFSWHGWDSATAPTGAETWSPASYTGTGKIRYVSNAYSPNGNLTSVLDGDNNTTKLVYDGHDRLQFTLFTDPTNPAATCSVPASDSLSPGCSANQSYEKYSYDKNGNRLSVRTRDNQTINYGYDLLSRLTLKDLPATTTGDIYTQYDLAGRIKYAHFGSATGSGVDYSYDTAGRLTSETQFMRQMSYGYDLSNNRILTTWPDSNHINYDFDALNREYQIRENGLTTGGGTLLANYAYDPMSRRQSITRANGTVTNFPLYDLASRLKTLAHDVSGSANDLTLSFTYTAASQLQTRTSSNPLYDWVSAAGTTAYVSDGLNRYTTVGGATLGYSDGRGNLTSDGTNSYSYDVENHLLSASGPTAVNMSYDPLGRLQSTAVGAAATQFLYSGTDLVAELDGSGTILRRYVHGPGTDEPIIWYEGVTLATRNYLHVDERGTVIATTNNTGAGTIYTYGPYGETPAWTGSRFRYTGQTMIPEAHLYYYKARVYSPSLGRFLQTDPVGTNDDLNLYAYTGNDPVNLADPTGDYSYVVARPLDSWFGKHNVGHAFIVTNARWIGDPDAHVYSFGELKNGAMGNVAFPGRASEIAEQTARTDYHAWLARANSDDWRNAAMIDAPDRVVEDFAQNVVEDRAYRYIPNPSDTVGTGNSTEYIKEANSNSAAFGIADASEKFASGDPKKHVDRGQFTFHLPGISAAPKVEFFGQPHCGTGISCRSGGSFEIWN
jgi:RHS repeat-associated protein